MTSRLVILLLLAAFARASPLCDPTFCFTTTTDGCVLSEVGVDCVECSNRGYLQDGSCVCETSLRPLDSTCGYVDPVVVSVPSNCMSDECEIAEGCVASVYGVRCSECLTRGYLVNRFVAGLYETRQCACYDPRNCDASARCAPLFNLSTVVELVSVQNIANVTPHNDPRLGYYAPRIINGISGVPIECAHEACGPSPNTFLSSSSLGQLTECNTDVAIDPAVAPCTTSQNENCGTKQICGGHGAWNNQCDCFAKWKLESTNQQGCDGSTAYACLSCEGWWGPSVYIAPTCSNPAQPDTCSAVTSMCSVPYTPDPVTGEDVECSGNGIYENGRCQCYASDQLGWWALRFVTGTFSKMVYVDGDLETVLYNSTVATCAGCLSGAGPPPSETENNPCSSIVFAPTVSPTTSPTSLERVTLMQLGSGDGFFDWEPTACIPDATTAETARVVESAGVSILHLAEAWGFSPSVAVYWLNGSLVADTWTLFAEGISNRTLEGLVTDSAWWSRPCSVNETESLARWTNSTTVDLLAAECDATYAYLCVDF